MQLLDYGIGRHTLKPPPCPQLPQHPVCIGFSFTQTTLLGVISIVSLGMVSGVFTVTHASIILLTSSANRWGRVMGFQVGMMGLYPFGSLLLGLTADTIGLTHAIRLFAVLGLLLLIVIWFRYTDLRKPI